MAINKHKGFYPSSLWFKKDELQKLSNAITTNNNQEALDILHEMHKRGDLWIKN